MWYLETSAFLKLVVDEAESAAMRAWWAGNGECWSSQLLRTESERACRRLGADPDSLRHALDALYLVLPSATTFHNAGRLEPSTLRSLDALHLATALDIGPALDGVVTYDQRLIDGARALSLTVVTPVE